jgi:phosphopantothenoylcysteine decarboxylase / phosphopantothenate---cysteine ligase
VCPAMHTEMWQHAATRANVATLRARGVDVVGPASGVLMGGDVGAGRVVEPEEALAAVEAALSRTRPTRSASVTALPSAGAAPSIGPGGDLAGRTVVVTAGGTREPIDPVRYLGNRSTGKMGFAVAAAAAGRGATVHLVAANAHLDTPSGVVRHDVTTALELRDAVLGLVDDADVVVKAAAVADFRPATVAASKIKKAAGIPSVELTRNPDVLAELGERRRGSPDPTRPLLVGFAAETDDPETHGWDKLRRKGADLLVVNDVSRPDAGFAADTNDVVILSTDGSRTTVPLASKAEVADRILDAVVGRLSDPDHARDGR